MTIIEAALLGLVQGLTEFIPVSSSGHLVLTEHLMGIHVSPEFDTLVNLGTLLALIFYFRQRILKILLDLFAGKINLVRSLLISFIPVGVVGLMFSDFFNSELIQNPWVVVVALASFGVIMITIDKLPKVSPLKNVDSITPKRAAGIGLFQVLSLIPGTSRSASTMIAGRIAGLSYKDAAEYSFLLSIPVMLGVLAYGFMSHGGQQFITTDFSSFLISNLVAFVSGLFAVGFMLKYLAKGNLAGFGYYRIAMAAVIALVLVL